MKALKMPVGALKAAAMTTCAWTAAPNGAVAAGINRAITAHGGSGTTASKVRRVNMCKYIAAVYTRINGVVVKKHAKIAAESARSAQTTELLRIISGGEY